MASWKDNTKYQTGNNTKIGRTSVPQSVHSSPVARPVFTLKHWKIKYDSCHIFTRTLFYLFMIQKIVQKIKGQKYRIRYKHGEYAENSSGLIPTFVVQNPKF